MAAVTQSAHPEPVPAEQLRASDADRQAVVDRLRRAHDEGRLDLAEYDERVRSAYAARTYAELARLTADLPLAPPPRPPVPGGYHQRPVPRDAVPAPAPAPRRRDVGGLVWRIVGSAWFSASLVNVLIWGIVCLSTGSVVYPWWIWVAGPWGAVLLAGWLSGLGRTRRR
jgi:hypothetical protein